MGEAPADSGCGGEQAARIESLQDQLLRLQADFENARKRWRKEQAQIQERANADLLRELLEIHDDLQRAIEVGGTVHPEGLEGGTVPARPLRQSSGRASAEPAPPRESGDSIGGLPPTGIGGSGRAASEFRAGVEMIARRMESFLRSYGIVPIEGIGKPFDPEFHEAVAHEPTDQAPEFTVLAELRRGYLMNGQVLRPAVVKVAVKKAANSE